MYMPLGFVFPFFLIAWDSASSYFHKTQFYFLALYLRFLLGDKIRSAAA
jgi:hypothetical protein